MYVSSCYSSFCSAVWSAQLSEERLKLLMRWRLISRWETLHPLIRSKWNLPVTLKMKGKLITVILILLLSQNLSRGLVNIAAKLTNTKDVRDFFIDLVEKVDGALIFIYILYQKELLICHRFLFLFLYLPVWQCDVTSPVLFSSSLLNRAAQTGGQLRTWNYTSLTTPTLHTFLTHSSELMCFYSVEHVR